MKILVAWLGLTDLRASRGEEPHGLLGPIGHAVQARAFDRLLLLCQTPSDAPAYIAWLQKLKRVPVDVAGCKLRSPTAYDDIYRAAVKAVSGLLATHGDDAELTFHLSPGTPAMQAVWIILSKTRFPAELLESSRESGVKTVAMPFDISAEFIPDLLRNPDARLQRVSEGLPPEAPEFDDILHRSAAMKRVIAQARKVAVRGVPVLIQGESGTGKELVAKAIHNASPRANRPFLVVNLGAISPELLNSELFGHAEGAFTGAKRAHDGYFLKADGGTLFLDEVGELPKGAQVNLLRALQHGEVTRVGETKSRKVDVRIIAASNRDLLVAAEKGEFREDLYYRLAVGVLYLPPLREREGDLSLLIDKLLDRIETEAGAQPGGIRKKLSPQARNLLLRHDWPGNVRELQNVLSRAWIWSSGDVIGVEAVEDALGARARSRNGLFPRDLAPGFDLRTLLRDVKRHYIEKALEEAGNRKNKAAELLGLPNYQTLTNWMKEVGLE